MISLLLITKRKMSPEKNTGPPSSGINMPISTYKLREQKLFLQVSIVSPF